MNALQQVDKEAKKAFGREFGERLREIESRFFHNRQQMADVAGVAKSTLQSWFNGTDPSMFAMVRIADHLQVSLDWLFLGDDMDPSQETRSAAPDPELLAYVIMSLEERLAKYHIEVDPRKKGRLIHLLYEHLAKLPESEREANAFVDSLVQV